MLEGALPGQFPSRPTLRVVDGSVVRESGPTGSLWRLHYAIGLPDLHCQEVHLGPQDDGETLKRFQVSAKARAIHAGWGLPSHIEGRLCAVRKTAVAAADARERVRRESLRGQTTLQPQTLEAADCVLIFTTLDATVEAADILAIYRLRWQIELAFKRLKSLLALGHLKKHDAQAARSWLQGKLVVAFLVARLIAHAERFSPWGYDLEAFAPPRDIAVCGVKWP